MIDLWSFSQVLDVGGWHSPCVAATHVVDRLPYETRYARLELDPLKGERFTKNTWLQANFLEPSLLLPYDDNFFDFVVCGHTVEDLSNPEPIIREMSRVGKRGVIICPSRLHEQTVGVRDRKSKFCGHPHHRWIVDATDDGIQFYAKDDSLLGRHRIPLLSYERIAKRDPVSAEVRYAWSDKINALFHRSSVCAERARSFVDQLNIRKSTKFLDGALRFRRRLLYRQADDRWWNEILERSRPYSSIDLSRWR